MFKLFLTLFFCMMSIVASGNEIKTDSYEDAISKRDIKVLVIMGADWCKHCVKLKHDLKNLNLDGYVITIVDVNERKDLKNKYEVKTLPTSFIVKNGEQLSKKTGYERNSYSSWLNENKDSYGYQGICCLNCCKCENCKIEKCDCCKCK